MPSELLIPDVIWVKPVAFLQLLRGPLDGDGILKVAAGMASCIAVSQGAGHEEAYELGVRMFRKAMEQEAVV